MNPHTSAAEAHSSQPLLASEKLTARPLRRLYSPPHDNAIPPRTPLISRSTRLRLYFFLLALTFSLIFLGLRYDQRLRHRMAASVPSGEPSTTETARWDALSEEEQLAEASEALMLEAGQDPARVAADFDDITLVGELDNSLVPQPDDRGSSSSGLGRRVIVVGDIHGMKSELEHLLKKVQFDREGDHLVSVGDMISKGPDSVGVVQLMMELGASAVRGNHEDRILLARKGMHSKSVARFPRSSSGPNSPDQEREVQDEEAILTDMDASSQSNGNKDRLLAKQFSKEQIKWLGDLPLILKIGDVEGLGNVVVVHGGLVPGIRLERQDPYAVMNMRTIDLKTREPSDSRKGSVWTKLFNTFQRSIPADKRMTVIYGHDARRGLSIGDYTKGIDSGCLKGGKLTAFVIERGQEGIKTSLVHVKCKNAQA